MWLQNARCGHTSNYEHDEPLNLDKREQMSYNVEARTTVDRRYLLPTRCRTLGPLRHHQDFRHYSSCLYYTDGPDPRHPAHQRAYDMAAIMALGNKCPEREKK